MPSFGGGRRRCAKGRIIALVNWESYHWQCIAIYFYIVVSILNLRKSCKTMFQKKTYQ